MKPRHSLFTLLILASAVLLLTGCGAKEKTASKPKKLPRVRTVAAEKTRLVDYLTTTGDVIATNAVTLRATVEGQIGCCPWREGDRVEQAGQKLIEIERPLYRQELLATEAALAVAQAKLDDLKAGARPEEIAQAKESVRHLNDCTLFAKADLDRIKRLVTSGSLPGEAVEKARVGYVKCQTQYMAAKENLAMLVAGPTKTEIAVLQTAVKQAAAQRDISQAKLDECLLTAPFAGIITQVYVRPGDLATPRAPLLKMMDPTSLVVRFALPETRTANIRKGAKAIIRLDAYSGKTFQATVERIYPRLERDTRTRLVEAKILDPVDLVPGLFARVSVVVRTADNAIAIPDEAIVTTPRGDKIVFVVRDGKASLRTVTLGLQQGQRVQVLKGIAAGEQVVISGNLGLKDGMAVQQAKAAPKTTAKTPEGTKS